MVTLLAFGGATRKQGYCGPPALPLATSVSETALGAKAIDKLHVDKSRALNKVRVRGCGEQEPLLFVSEGDSVWKVGGPSHVVFVSPAPDTVRWFA